MISQEEATLETNLKSKESKESNRSFKFFEDNDINWIATILLLIGSLAILFPLYLAINVALKSPQQLAQSILAFPKELHWENFTKAMELTHYFRSFKNSSLVTVPTVIITLLTNSMVAYAIARNLDKKFFKFLYYYFIAALFIPFPIIMLPIVKEMSFLGLDNRLGLTILYIVYGLSMNIFIYISYIKSLPGSLEEAAIIDGASTWQIFWKIIFPLLKPINATIAILTALWAWNDFMLPLIMLNDRKLMTLPLVQYVFQSQFSTNYNLAFASYLLALAPMILVYIFAQKWIISGVMKGSVKG
ncbi:carbohydrate ABC transporter membrane protein 2 (CUT1 family) [Orenia metallireducens]|uniref:Carbohydrate ABC transporter membrane protein 2, CUT1 family n=1 Tax=Orenia metallireducens TaxID=1413210 RepID=A0A285H482_9FIRM|nr:carbohydrate ABC transporter permease [Orenia metallireducens]PRX28582.1 carbohydrate ABC transporter membrane protein 2 (CUT1 family) [Orenia metallireducens]SNY30572.1 carbohydrate ABC transporter membrane protein 2, CUT1 family [Orenia metallireducens]